MDRLSIEDSRKYLICVFIYCSHVLCKYIQSKTNMSFPLTTTVGSTAVEAVHLANLLCQFGYYFPVNELKNLIVKDDSSLYRFQVNDGTRRFALL